MGSKLIALDGPATARTLVFAVALGFATGCMGLPRCAALPSQYVVVERQQSELRGGSAQPEITPTAAYHELRSTFRTVALRLPDNCFFQAELHSGANAEAAKLESRCGIPLQVLERALTRNGFQVLSWSTLMGIERQQNVPVHVAAQQLGADIVIIVNDMYVGLENAAASTEATYRYYVSDNKGTRVQPMQLFEADRNWLKTFVRERAGADPQAVAGRTLQARLNATIVLAKGREPVPAGDVDGSAVKTTAPPAASPAAPFSGRSGEAIWFYNWRVGKASNDSNGLLFLFAGIPVSKYSEAFEDRPPIDASDPNRHYWWPVHPVGDEKVPQPPRDVATSEETFKTNVGIAPEAQAVLYRQIADDFINRFRGF
jgi:hypothetical protein